MAVTQEVIDGIQEKVVALENRIQLLEIIAKKTISETQAEPQRQTKDVIQINANGKRYFCTTPEEQEIFSRNNPGVETETFKIELSIATADKYLNDAENKRQFAIKD